MVLQPELADRLRTLDAAKRVAEAEARKAAGRAFSETVAEPRRAYLQAILDAVDAGASRGEIADAIQAGRLPAEPRMSRQRVQQLIREARREARR